MSGLAGQVGIFLGSLFLMGISSFVLTVALERIGARLHLAEGLLGFLTALGADAPEISSSITALTAGHHELGVGVVLGSNVFNLAALLGVSALIAGVVRVGAAGALLNGGVSLMVTVVAGALLLRWISPPLAIGLMALLFVPYLGVIAAYPSQLKRLPLPPFLKNFLARATANVQEDCPRTGMETAHVREATLIDWFVLVPGIFSIVAGSQGIVYATVKLSGRFGISHGVAGALAIAGLTGIPNAIAAIRLATRHRGAAVITECLNSNSANLVCGICLPALFVGLGAVGAQTYFSLGWLFAMSAAAIGLLCWRGGLRRLGGSVLVGLYLLFAGAVICWPLLIGR